MTYFEAILAVLVSLPSTYVERAGIADPPEYGETVEQRADRLKDVAEELARYTPLEAAGAIAIGNGESTFAWYALLDCARRPKGASGDCDRVKWGPRKGEVRARSYFQLWENTCASLWKVASGSREAVRIATACAVKHWRSAYYRCKREGRGSTAERAFSAYGGRGCTRKGRSEKKAKTFAWALSRLQSSYNNRASQHQRPPTTATSAEEKTPNGKTRKQERKSRKRR